MKQKEKQFRNVQGEYLYLFDWTCGGFNDVWARSKKEAYRLIIEERKDWENKNPSHSKLRPIYKSIRRCTYSQYQKQNHMGWMMSI